MFESAEDTFNAVAAFTGPVAQARREARLAAAALIGRPVCGDCGRHPAAPKGNGRWRTVCSSCRLRRRDRASGRSSSARAYQRIGRRHKDACEGCGLPCSFASFFDVDHKLARSHGGSNRQDNLQLLCPNCHRFKTLVERGLLPEGTPPNAWRERL